jgi:hypothetical protein
MYVYPFGKLFRGLLDLTPRPRSGPVVVDQTIQQLDDYLLNHLETKTAIFSNGYYVHRYMHDSMDPVSQWMMNTAVRRLLVSGIRSMGWNKVLRTHA